jgi:hypothetical protein
MKQNLPDQPAKDHLQSSAKGTGYLLALAALNAALREAASGENSSVAEARRAFEQQVERELIEPLQQSFSRSPDPVLAAVGAHIATLCVTLHRLGPRLKAFLARTVTDRKNQQSQWTSGPSLMIKHHVELVDRLLALLKEVTRWQTARH